LDNIKHMVLFRVVGAMAAVVAVAAGGIADSRLNSAPPVAVIRTPEGGIQPQVATDRDGTIHLVYFKGDAAHGDVFYTRISSDARFAPAIRVNSTAGSAIATGSVRGAHLAIGSHRRVHVAWMGSAQTHAPAGPAPVFYARMSDDGRAFEPQRNLTRNQSIGPDGGALAADAAGNVYVTWHALLTGGKGEADRRLLLARSRDDGRTFAPERAISDPAAGACACCGTGTFVDHDGTVYALFRSAREAIHRDTFLLRSTDRGTTFTSQNLHPWEINACPMSTYAFARGPAGSAIAAAWETGGEIYWTRIDARTGNPSRLIAVGRAEKNQKHPASAIDGNGRTMVAWSEGTGWSRGGAVAWQIFDPGGHPIGARGSVPALPAWGLVAVYARSGGGFTVVY
jgi:hypothetical protein